MTLSAFISIFLHAGGANLEYSRKRIEEPSMTVYLLGVFLFETEYNLTRYNSFVGISKAKFRIQSEGRSVFEYVSRDVLVFNTGLHDTILVNACP